MSYANFKVDLDGDGIALVTWDVPDRSMNVISLAGIEELAALVEQLAVDAAVKGVVITSGKEAFCAGADLTLLEGLGRTCSRKVASCRRCIGGSRPAASRGSPPSTAPRSAAGSSSRSPVTIA
jgi:enoyl-CoA hydratase/carnithine racemase